MQHFSTDISSDEVTRLADVLRPDRGLSLFAVLDGCTAADEALAFLAQGLNSVPLQRGYTDAEQQRRMPWLVELPLGSPALATLLHGFGRGWGIFLHSRESFWELVKHLIDLPVCVSPSGKHTWLRWYVPCFLRVLARDSNAEFRQRLYGDKVAAFFAEDPDNRAFSVLEAPANAPAPPSMPPRLDAELLERLDEARMRELVRRLRVYGLKCMEQSNVSTLLCSDGRRSGSPPALCSHGQFQNEIVLGNPAPGPEELFRLDENLEALVERVAGYGIHELESLMICLNAAGAWGWNFDQTRPEAREALVTEGAPGWMRAIFLRNILEEGNL